MDCFLVMAHCDLDDVPLRLFRTADEARGYIALLKSDEIIEMACRVYGANVGPFCDISLVPVRGGDPGVRELVRRDVDLMAHDDTDDEDE